MSERRVLDQSQVAEAVSRMVDGLWTMLPDDRSQWYIAGIQRRGVPLARRIAEGLQAKGAPPLSVGTLDITLYRDDMSEASSHPVVMDTELLLDLTGRTVVLVDDVLFTGRTIRSALLQLMDFGRPSSVRLAVLVDRGHRELPISADVTGCKLETSRRDTVEVHVAEVDGEDAVWMKEGRKSTARGVL